MVFFDVNIFCSLIFGRCYDVALSNDVIFRIVLQNVHTMSHGFYEHFLHSSNISPILCVIYLLFSVLYIFAAQLITTTKGLR